VISIVVVYNDQRALDEILLKSLRNQTSKYELIAVENAERKFESAAEALNYGGRQAKGEYIVFIHQDVQLDSASWLERVERILDSIPDLGIAGVAGMSEKGESDRERGRGCISDCGEIWQWSNPVQVPEEVQTLDECLLIVPKLVFSRMQFDEKTFDGWHAYGADYCLRVRRMGLKAYVIPAFVYHRSLRRNVKDLLEYQERLYNKHKGSYKRVFTTSGEISLRTLKLRMLVRFFEPSYRRLFPSWICYLKEELAGSHSVLDLGCGYDSLLRYCNVPFLVGVELFDPYLRESKMKKIHNEYVKADMRQMEFKPKSFDVLVALDVLEHLTRREGYELMKKAEKWSRKLVIFTPNGYVLQNGYDANPLQVHRSGWTAKDLEKLGFKVVGINGWKQLRGYKASMKYKPQLLWTIISDLTQKITRRCPKLAFQLLAVKATNGEDK